MRDGKEKRPKKSTGSKNIKLQFCLDVLASIFGFLAQMSVMHCISYRVPNVARISLATGGRPRSDCSSFRRHVETAVYMYQCESESFSQCKVCFWVFGVVRQVSCFWAGSFGIGCVLMPSGFSILSVFSIWHEARWLWAFFCFCTDTLNDAWVLILHSFFRGDDQQSDWMAEGENCSLNFGYC